MTHYRLPNLPYLSLVFELEAQENSRLPTFKGSLLRGIFGNALRRTVCLMHAQKQCADCFLNRQCVNTRIFETFIFDEPPRFMKGIKTAPRPFTFFCDDAQTDYPSGATFRFEMRLIGNTDMYLPYIVYAVQRMGKMGIGSKRHPFFLAAVHLQNRAGEREKIFDGKSEQLLARLTPEPAYLQADGPAPESLDLHFLSPTHFKTRGAQSLDFNFRQLLFIMLRRTLELAHFYQPETEIDWEFHELLVAANDVEISDRKLTWKSVRRYSSRQKREMTFRGFTGSLRISGDLAPFMPVLHSAEALHVGKRATFGLGRMQLGNFAIEQLSN